MRRFGMIFATLLVVCGVLLFRPLEGARIASHPHPAPNYAAALAGVHALQSLDGPQIAGGCGTRLMTHGAPTRRVFVLYHGLTNCPEQFRTLAESLYVRGANVLIPRLPHHGLADRMTGDLDRLEARELCAWSDRTLDAAAGPGDSVTVVGLSLSAVVAAWAGEERAGIDRVVVIAPLLEPRLAAGPLAPAAARFLLTQRGRFAWWDGKLKQDVPGPRHVYPRFSLHATGEALCFGAGVLATARQSPLRARSAVVVTVAGDRAIDNAAAHRLAAAWHAKAPGRASEYEFPAALGVVHDMIDPEQVGAKTAVVYPVLMRLMGM